MIKILILIQSFNLIIKLIDHFHYHLFSKNFNHFTYNLFFFIHLHLIKVLIFLVIRIQFFLVLL